MYMTNHGSIAALAHRKAPWLILFFLLLTALLYFFQPISTTRETDLIIPVELLHVKEGLTTTTPLGSTVEIRVSGPEKKLKDLTSRKLTCTLDLSDADVGVAAFPVDRECIQLPKRVSIEKIHPAFLTVRIEPEIQKEAPVIVTLTGKPAPGFYIDDALKKPASITLRGPQSLIDPIDAIRTKPLDANGLTESIKKEVALDLPVGVTAAAPSELITVELLVKERIETRVFEEVPVTGKDASFEFGIVPPVIRIEIKGPVNTLDKLQLQKALAAHVDLKALEPGVYARRAVILLPVGVSLIAASPEIFTVRISKRKKQNSE